MKYRNRYEYVSDGYPKHNWIVIGRHGAMHFHVVDMGERTDGLPRYSGGVEFHFRSPPSHMENDAPSHDQCWVLKAPCWHDGSSMYAEEVLIPLWLATADHEVIFRRLQGLMEDSMKEDKS